LHELDFLTQGFQWIDCHDADQSVVSWLRRGRDGRHAVIVLNFTPVPRHGYRLGVPLAQDYVERSTPTRRTTVAAIWATAAASRPRRKPGWAFPPRSLTLPPLAALVLLPA
jgi:1,4-alpha-glucan branching enzyme